MNDTAKPKIIVIAGPTGSGKTEFSIKLATACDGEIINADSMQVYRGMDIGTAKPSAHERKGIPHHLLDVVNPDEEFNAAKYLFLAFPKVVDINRQGRVCILVGGTGLYIKSLLHGLFDVPEVDSELRKSLKQQCDLNGSLFLHEKLKIIDPEAAAAIHPNDSVRIIRALEIFHLSEGRPSDLRKKHHFNENHFDVLKFCLDVDRNELYRRVNLRSDKMIESGLASETKHLLDNGYSPDLRSMNSIGYRHMVKYIKKEWSLDEAVEVLKRDTRRYAKRQLTWFRNEPGFNWIDPEKIDTVVSRVENFIGKG